MQKNKDKNLTNLKTKLLTYERRHNIFEPHFEIIISNYESENSPKTFLAFF